MARRATSVQWRILVRQLPLMAIVFFAVLFWLGEHVRQSLYEADLELARRSSLLTVSAVKASMESERAHASWSRVLDEVPLREGAYVEVLSTEGEVLFATEPSLIGTRYRLTDPSCAVCHVGGDRKAEAETAHLRGAAGEQSQVFAMPLRNTEACARCHDKGPAKLGMVYVHQPLAPLNRQVRTLQLGLLLAGVVSLLLTIVTTRVLLGRYLGKPLKALVKGAERIGAGQLDTRIELAERTEISSLAETLNNSAARLREMVGTLARQRDDFQALYGLADQLSRAVLPDDRRRRSVHLATKILKRECALVRSGSLLATRHAGGTVTYRGPDGVITDVPLDHAADHDLPSFYSPALVKRWLDGELDESVEVREGVTIAYALKRGERRLGLLLTSAGDVAASRDAADPGMVDALLNHLGVALAYSDLQSELIDRERLAAIGETVAGLAHCMKNMLNGLHAGLYITNRALELEDESKLEDGLRILTRSVGRVERLTFDMLYYIKERAPRREPVDLNEVMREVVDILSEDASRKGIELRTELDDAVGEVPVDRTAIFRAVLNLATNAIDACTETETGDLVRLRTSLGDGEVVLAVEDNGSGMTEAVRRSLFTRFFSTKQSQGTGLGLPVVRKVVEEHGGTLTFDSEPGKGSEFRMVLPIG